MGAEVMKTEAWQVGVGARRGKGVGLLACAVKSLGQLW